MGNERGMDKALTATTQGREAALGRSDLGGSLGKALGGTKTEHDADLDFVKKEE